MTGGQQKKLIDLISLFIRIKKGAWAPFFIESDIYFAYGLFDTTIVGSCDGGIAAVGK